MSVTPLTATFDSTFGTITLTWSGSAGTIDPDPTYNHYTFGYWSTAESRWYVIATLDTNEEFIDVSPSENSVSFINELGRFDGTTTKFGISSDRTDIGRTYIEFPPVYIPVGSGTGSIPPGPDGYTTIPYPSPENLVATANANGTISLSWNTKDIPTSVSNPILGYKVSIAGKAGTDGSTYNWTINVPSTSTYHSANGRMANYYTTDVLVANTTNATMHVLINSIKLTPTSEKTAIPAGLTIRFVLTPQYKNDIPSGVFTEPINTRVTFPDVTTLGATTMPTTTGTNTYIGCITAISAVPTGGYDTTLLATNPSSASTPTSGSGSSSGGSSSGGSGSGGSSSGTAPDAPTNPVGNYTVFNGTPKLSVQWTAPANTGGSSIASYTVTLHHEMDLISVMKSTTVGGALTGYNSRRNDIGNGIPTIYYKIVATNAAGLTSTAAVGSASISNIEAPSPPQDVSCNIYGNTAVVTWSEPSSAGGSSPLSYVGTMTGPGYSQTARDTSVGKMWFTDLIYGETYSLSIVAYNKFFGSTPASLSNIVLTVPGEKAPSLVVANASSSGTVVLSWVAPTTTNPVQSYTISELHTRFSEIIGVDASSNSYTLSSLTAGTSYTCKITANYAVDNFDNASFANECIPFTNPSPPTIISTSIGDSFIRVSWTPPSSNGAGTITSNTVSVYLPDATLVKTVSATSSPAIVDGLTNGTTYTVKVKSVNRYGGISADSDPATATPALATTTPTKDDVKRNPGVLKLKRANCSAISSSLGTAPINLISLTGNGVPGEVLEAPNDIAEGSAVYITTSEGTQKIKFGAVVYDFTFSGKLVTISPGYDDGVSIGQTITLGGISLEVTDFGSLILKSKGPASATAICFLGNAPVLTPAGYKRIDSLRVGDLVSTADGKTAAIQRVFKQTYEPSVGVNPYVIPAGRFGATRRLLLSPDHCVAVDGAMVKARNLGLQQQEMTGPFVYYNLELPSWKNMVVAGVEVESLAPKTRVRMTMEVFTEYLNRLGLNATVPMVRRAVRYLQDGTVEVHGCFKPRDRK